MSLKQFRNFTESILRLPRLVKRGIAVAVDAAICVLTVAVAYRLRLDGWIFPTGNQWYSYALAIGFAVPIFIKMGLYRAIFRYVGWHALSNITIACIVYGAFYSLTFSVIGFTLVPRSIGFLQPILLFIGIFLSRSLGRLWLGDGNLSIFTNKETRRVLIYGAGSAGRQLAGGLADSKEMQVVAFIDDDVKLRGSYLNGKPIFSPDRLDAVIDERSIDDVLLAIPSASRRRIGEIVDELKGLNVSVRILPGIFELANGKVTVSSLRPIEIEDLLGRDAVPPVKSLIGKCITGKTVLVTGAGGSIGSELCRQIIQQKPHKIILIDQNEYNLYSIDQELSRMNFKNRNLDVIPVLASVTDKQLMEKVFSLHRPNTVYHAAAYKHVPLVELNPMAAAHNNIMGTKIIAELANKWGTTDFVLISTDKAVRPPNIMGATKRIAEMVLQVMSQQRSQTCFSMVRFGNVLGSSGSVVPLFRSQISSGGPVTVTHREVTRYFMTIPEAAQLVIQAGAMAQGGEVFVLDMGEPVKILDLAERMIELSGLSVKDEENPDGDIEIKISGLRPGEKLYEELLIGDNPLKTDHPRIMKARDNSCTQTELEAFLKNMKTLKPNVDRAGLAKILQPLVPEVLVQQIDE